VVAGRERAAAQADEADWRADELDPKVQVILHYLVPADWRRYWLVRRGSGLRPISGHEVPSRPTVDVDLGAQPLKIETLACRVGRADQANVDPLDGLFDMLAFSRAAVPDGGKEAKRLPLPKHTKTNTSVDILVQIGQRLRLQYMARLARALLLTRSRHRCIAAS
jgi:hypothetical protein